MTCPSDQFLKELESFRIDAESAIQFFYAHFTIHQVAGMNRRIKVELDKEPMFWNTTLTALQTSGFIALGRIFDQNSKHNIDRLLQSCQKNIVIFCKEELRKRKMASSRNASEWIEQYMKTAFEPSQDDFKRLRRHVLKYRRTYEARYRDIRSKVYAHKELSDSADIRALFSKTKINELQKLLVFLVRLHSCLQEIFFNGRKPSLPRMRFSIIEMLGKPTPKYKSLTSQERIVLSTKGQLESLVAKNA